MSGREEGGEEAELGNQGAIWPGEENNRVIGDDAANLRGGEAVGSDEREDGQAQLGDAQGTSGRDSDGQGEVAVVDVEVHGEGVTRRRGNGRGGVAGGRPSLFGERGGKQAEEVDAPLEQRSRRRLGSEIERIWSSIVGGNRNETTLSSETTDSVWDGTRPNPHVFNLDSSNRTRVQIFPSPVKITELRH